MANISIPDLNPPESESSIMDLKNGENSLIKASVKRALDTRSVIGAGPVRTMGIIMK